jgi:glucose dehydrogenase
LPSRRKASREGEWRNYFGDTNGTKYSPLRQIDRTNVGSLRVAWRWASADRALQLSKIRSGARPATRKRR